MNSLNTVMFDYYEPSVDMVSIDWVTHLWTWDYYAIFRPLLTDIGDNVWHIDFR